MRFTITFFGNKRHKRVYKKLEKTKEYFNIKSCSSTDVKPYDLIVLLVLAIVMITKFKTVIFLGSNISVVAGIDITKESIISVNSIADISNYIFGEDIIQEEETEKITNDEYLAMDKIVEEFNTQVVFGSITQDDVVILEENTTYQRISICGVEIVNYSSNRDIDFVSILNSDDIILDKTQDEVLLYTTHTSESYANSENYTFEYTSAGRTTDGQFNMLAIASTLASNLNDKSINTVCSLTPHDYGEYNSAYTNSRLTVTTLLQENSNISVLIDVHRDAIEDLSYAPKVNIRGYDVACLMLVMGIGYEGEENPYYVQNLKLALQLQILANKVYPGLFKSMIIRNSIYNQDLSANSFLIEVGATGNTIDEAKISTRCLANLINMLCSN